MLVRDNILKILAIVDPTYKDMSLITAANIATVTTGWATVGGDKFTSQKIVDCYNQARMQLANAIDKTFPEDKKAIAVSGNIVVNTTATFASGVLAKPTGYIMYEYLTDVNGDQITILPVSQIQQAKDLESATNRMVFDYGSNFTALTGLTNIPNASTYIFRYYGVTQYTTVTATDGTTVESFNDLLHPALIELAVAIANDQGTADINMMALKLMGGA
jgi:hypothetical protein